MTLYYIVFSILALLSIVEEFGKINLKTKRIIIYFISAFFVLLSTIYYGRMGDYFHYSAFFDIVNFDYVLHPNYSSFEILYVMINYIVRIFTSYYFILRFVLATIVMTLMAKTYSFFQYDYVGRHALTIVFVFWAMKTGMIFVIRSSIAVAICQFSIRYIEEKKIVRYLICVLFAIGFHTLSVVWLVAYPVYHRRNIRKYLYGVLIVSALFSEYIPTFLRFISNYLPYYIGNKIRNYLGYGNSLGGISYDYIFVLLKAVANMILIIFVFQYISRKNQKILDSDSVSIKTSKIDMFDGLYNLYIVGAIIYVLALNASYGLGRAALPYTTIQFYLIPKVLDLPGIQKDRKNKIIIYGIFFLYVFIRFYFDIHSYDYNQFNTIF